MIRALTDKKFYCDRLELQGHKVYEVLSHEFDGENFGIKFKRKLPTGTIVHEDRWNVSSKTGSVAVELQSMPIEMSGITALSDIGDECVMTYDWNIRSSIPLVGGKIEKAIAAENDKAIPEQTRA